MGPDARGAGGRLPGSPSFTRQVQHPMMGGAMGKSYSHLSLEERIEIYHHFENGLSQRAIARRLGHAPSTISRELRRSARPTKQYAGGYKPERAHGLAARRRCWDARFKLQRQPALREMVRQRLETGLPGSSRSGHGAETESSSNCPFRPALVGVSGTLLCPARRGCGVPAEISSCRACGT